MSTELPDVLQCALGVQSLPALVQSLLWGYAIHGSCSGSMASDDLSTAEPQLLRDGHHTDLRLQRLRRQTPLSWGKAGSAKGVGPVNRYMCKWPR